MWIHVLDVLSNALDRGDLTYHELPLIFLPCQEPGTIHTFCEAVDENIM